jgi:hypothetical protein
VAPAAWSYYGPAVLDEINSVGGDVAEDFYRRLYEVLQRPRNAPRVMLTKNRPSLVHRALRRRAAHIYAGA